MLRKIAVFIAKEYKWLAIAATGLLFAVSFVNGISIIAIIPFINSTGFSGGASPQFVEKIVNAVSSRTGVMITPVNMLLFLFLLLVFKAVLNVGKGLLCRIMQLNERTEGLHRVPKRHEHKFL